MNGSTAMVITIMVITSFLVGLVCYLYGRSNPGGIYQNPNLHDGNWTGPNFDGRQGHMTVTWAKIGGHPICVGGNHAPVSCTVGPGMAHVDRCSCNSKRYGVYGSWS